MKPEEEQQIIVDILNRAEKLEFTEFRFIGNWTAYNYFRREYKTTKLVIKMLRESADKLFKTYCKEVTLGDADLDELIAFKQLLDVKDFYEKELDILNRMLADYEDYLFHGNLLNALLGEERKL